MHPELNYSASCSKKALEIKAAEACRQRALTKDRQECNQQLSQIAIVIETTNSAFFTFDGKPNATSEICRILRDLIVAISRGTVLNKVQLRDYNGNPVGHVTFR
ncbi:hypothetical protein LCGC14_1266970 [marine sediment metagenome]|uniref:Uncharacterized protein n=1 Tax=marine sediment metagenome TaxID=412755 RepID=A0A0F9KZ89_9ZZZZ